MSQFVKILLKISSFEKKLVFFVFLAVFSLKTGKFWEKLTKKKNEFYAVFTIFGWDFVNLLNFVDNKGKNRFLCVFLIIFSIILAKNEFILSRFANLFSFFTFTDTFWKENSLKSLFFSYRLSFVISTYNQRVTLKKCLKWPKMPENRKKTEKDTK